MTEKTCINCNRTDEKIPLITITFKGEEKHICPQCLPVLIHKTHLLADKLPGIETESPAGH
jgi:hypothetical protein